MTTVIQTIGRFQRVVLTATLALGALSQATAGETITFLHNDIAGSPMLATDVNGLIAWKETYRPYGDRVIDSSAASNNDLWFTGKPHDETTGLTYMGARYYDPVLGRFTGVDPVSVNPSDVHGMNRYAYANNNPYKFIDPDGRFAQAIIGGIVGGLVSGGVELFRQATAGRGFDGKAIAVQTGKGVVVGAITATVPAAIAANALNFGSKTANIAVSLGNATAAGAAGEVASQALTSGGPIDAGQALGAGAANAFGLGVGIAVAAPARALSTTIIPGNPGLPVTSLSGRTFMIGAQAPGTIVNETLQQSLQDVSGETASAVVDKLINDE